MLQDVLNFVLSSTPRTMGALAIACFSGAALVHGSPVAAAILAGLGFVVWAIAEGIVKAINEN